MFCANCGKNVDDDAQFCPNCGAKATEEQAPTPESAASAVPPEPTPSAVPPAEPATAAPEPTAAAAPPQPEGASPTPEPTPSAVPPAQAEPTASAIAPAAPTAASQPVQPAPGAPPPQQPPAAPAEGEPPKKKSSSCWIMGCIIFAVVFIVGGGGIFLGLRYMYHKGQEGVQQLQQQMEQMGEQAQPRGGEQSEGTEGDGEQPGGEGGQTPEIGRVDWDQVGVDMPPETRRALQEAMDQLGDWAQSEEFQRAMRQGEAAGATIALYQFFAAWQTGDAAAVKKLVVPELGDAVDEYIPEPYAQSDLRITEQKKLSDNEWQYAVEEDYRLQPGGELQTEHYGLHIKNTDKGWLVSKLEIALDS